MGLETTQDETELGTRRWWEEWKEVWNGERLGVRRIRFDPPVRSK